MLSQAEWKGVFGIRTIPEAERWRWFFKVFFFEKEWHPSQGKPKAKKKKAVKKKKAAIRLGQLWGLAKNMLRAVDVKRFYIDWDTDDFIQNARLYPAFQLLSGGNRQLHINFMGKQELAILLQTRPYRLAWAFLQVFFHSKNSRP